MDAEASPRILISRLSAVGDCILTIPLATALRERFPSAFIAWVVQGGCAAILEGHSALDRLIVVKKGWLRSPQEVTRLRSKLRAMQFDVTLDPQSLSKSAIAAWLSGAPRRIGFARPLGRELAPLLNNQTIAAQATHVVDCQRELLKPLGVEPGAARFGIPIRTDARRFAADFLEKSRLHAGYVLLNPGAGWDSKLWPAERYGAVARCLAEKLKLPSVVVWSGDRERAWAETIVEQSGGHSTLAPSTTLPQLAALAAGARLFVGSDTGPLHLAAALGTPCVGLYGPTRPEVCGPYGPGHQAVQAFYQEGAGRERRGADNRAMQAITVEMVCDACARAFDGRREKAA
jgi:lipopolysaccharide heptosyltransferase I